MWTQADLQTLLHKARLIRLSLRKGWMNRILVAWIVLGVIGVPLIVWNRKQSQEGSRRRDLHYWCLERARLLEDQVVLNKNMAKVSGAFATSRRRHRNCAGWTLRPGCKVALISIVGSIDLTDFHGADFGLWELQRHQLLD